MRLQLHHLYAAYLDKAAAATTSSSSPPLIPSSAFPAFAFKCLRPLAPKISFPEPRKMIAPPADHFGRARINTSKLLNSTVQLPTSTAGTTRWNPSPEQIKVLEMLYRGGMRTPNSVQIDRITEELGKYGRIEGKNVFYWFQNHKARERQKQKLAALLTLSTLDSSSLPAAPETKEVPEKRNKKEAACDDLTISKRRCKAPWGGHGDAADCTTDDVTLELFPLRPQGKA
ncbi:hypothetical protein GUJ93_ZPchr0004g38364 [Zizania palustris]|uniref:Homeobox domain-containing protein n=1 Tax=Zizania palustris TaxID=103762 RepID=A0A8J5VPS5_ZIZPA|nr:hypothetical protein GUJ93_ZPchr0004g38364 [Zizania palustris]